MSHVSAAWDLRSRAAAPEQSSFLERTRRPLQAALLFPLLATAYVAVLSAAGAAGIALRLRNAAARRLAGRWPFASGKRPRRASAQPGR